MLIYTVFLITFIISRRGSNTTVSTEIKDLQKDPERHQPGLGTFRIGIGVSGIDQQLFYNESFFKIEIYQGVTNRDGLVAHYNPTEIGTSIWDSEFIELASISNAADASATICPTVNNYNFSGTHASETFEFLTIYLQRWSSYDNVTWASDAEIDARMNGGRLNVVIINSYVDFDDYDQVVKTYVDER